MAGGTRQSITIYFRTFITEPVHLISLGAGVQSSAMALMAARGELTPMPTAAIFADTQAEPDSVYSWLDWLESRLPFPVYRVTAGSLADEALKMRTTKDGRSYTITSLPYFTLSADNKLGKVPHRSCTVDYKIIPILKKAREIGKIKRGQKSIGVIQWIGISVDEASRMKPSRDSWCESRWPLIEARLSRNDCLHWMRANKFPEPPRSACVFCPFHNDNEWRRLKNDDAVAFERAVALRKGLTANFKSQIFLHRKCIPLDQVDFSTEEQRGQINMFENECEGMCGV